MDIYALKNMGYIRLVAQSIFGPGDKTTRGAMKNGIKKGIKNTTGESWLWHATRRGSGNLSPEYLPYLALYCHLSSDSFALGSSA